MIRLRRHVADLAPVHHGSITDPELDALGLTRDQVIDFSVNTHPFGPSPTAVEAARGAVWTAYPDDGACILRRELAAHNRVTKAEVVVGNGSVELIWLIALAFLEPGDAVVVVGPTFGEYARATRIAGGIVHEYHANLADSFAIDLTAVTDLVRCVDARLVFLCNPNNPTGSLVPLVALRTLAEQLPETLVVVDEAYRQFLDEPPPSTSLLACGNVMLLRSLTKDYALTGLRLGYVLAPAQLTNAVDRVRPHWNVNAIACAVGLAAMRDDAHLERGRAEVRRARAYLTAALTDLGLRVLPATANFILVDVGEARQVRAALLRHGICVRDCSSFGLPTSIRIGLRPLAACERLVAACIAAGVGARAGARRG
ncbi:MAG TPA: histidinol-phosphate transaminase [Chloroflexota bacterium]|nr:histidinol-phosphate transaminase [Chloroflexota bacterium]